MRLFWGFLNNVKIKNVTFLYSSRIRSTFFTFNFLLGDQQISKVDQIVQIEKKIVRFCRFRRVEIFSCQSVDIYISWGKNFNAKNEALDLYFKREKLLTLFVKFSSLYAEQSSSVQLLSDKWQDTKRIFCLCAHTFVKIVALWTMRHHHQLQTDDTISDTKLLLPHNE